MRLKIKYCGGCNPSINRKKVVDEVIAYLKQHTDIELTKEDEDVVLIMNGCSVSCADLSDVDLKKTIIVGGSSVDFYQVKPVDLAATIARKVLEKEVDIGCRAG